MSVRIPRIHLQQATAQVVVAPEVNLPVQVQEAMAEAEAETNRDNLKFSLHEKQNFQDLPDCSYIV